MDAWWSDNRSRTFFLLHGWMFLLSQFSLWNMSHYTEVLEGTITRYSDAPHRSGSTQLNTHTLTHLLSWIYNYATPTSTTPTSTTSTTLQSITFQNLIVMRMRTKAEPVVPLFNYCALCMSMAQGRRSACKDYRMQLRVSHSRWIKKTQRESNNRKVNKLH